MIKKERLDRYNIMFEGAIDLINNGCLYSELKMYFNKIFRSNLLYNIKALEKFNPELYENFISLYSKCKEESIKTIKSTLLLFNSAIEDGIKINDNVSRSLDDLDIILFCKNYISGYSRQDITKIIDELYKEVEEGKYENYHYKFHISEIKKLIQQTYVYFNFMSLKNEECNTTYVINGQKYIITEEEHEFIKKFIKDNNLSYDTYTVELLERRCFLFRNLNYDYKDYNLYSPIVRTKNKK